MEKTMNIGGRLHNTAVGGALTGANEIKDDTKGKMQNVINQETDAELLRLDGAKQDKLTFDQTPTGNSTNPVTSGGVYAADAALQQTIEAILLLIPSAASALNQLADKAFVNSSISTATATFRGTYNSVTDLHLAIDATHQQIADALLSTVATADNNDYCYVQVPVSSTTFDIRRTARYKFNGTAWVYEYDLNTSGYTAAQWAAINSGITQALVGDLVDIKSYIPAEATSLNQLADKAYVVAQILAGIPAFKGQFTTLADLQAVSSPKAGDIGIVRTKDYDGYDVFTFYQYLNSQWNVYYTLQRHPQVKPATTGATGDYPYNGMGCIELPKNIVNGVNVLMQDMMSAANTKYVIKYDFTLGEDITVPANCVLEFDGGSINGNNILIGQNTEIIAGINTIFSDIAFNGTFVTKTVYPEWFKRIDEYWNESIQSAIDFAALSCGIVELTQQTYIITGLRTYNGSPDIIYMRSKTSLISYNKSEIRLAANSYQYTEDYEAVIGNVYNNNGGRAVDVVINGIRINQESEILVDPQLVDITRGLRCIALYNCVNLTINNCSFYTKGSNAICLLTNMPTNLETNTGNKITNNEIVFLEKEYDYDQSGIFLITNSSVVSNNVIKDLVNSSDKKARGGIELHGSFLTATDNTIIGLNTGFNITPHRGYMSSRNAVISNNNMTDGKTFVRIWPEDLSQSVVEHVELIDTEIYGNVCTNLESFFHIFNGINKYKATINGISINNNIFKRTDSFKNSIFHINSLGIAKNVSITNNIIYNADRRVLFVSDSNAISGEASVAEVDNIVFADNFIYSCFKNRKAGNNEDPLLCIVLTKSPIDYNKVIIKNNIIDIRSSAEGLPYVLKGRCFFDVNIFPHELSLMIDKYMTTGTFNIFDYIKDSKLSYVDSFKIRNNISSVCTKKGVDKSGTITGILRKESPYSMIELSNPGSVDVGDTIQVTIGSVVISSAIVFSKIGSKITIGWFNTSNLNNGDSVEISFIESEWRPLQGNAQGSWGNRPSPTNVTIPIGYSYFCTDKPQTPGSPIYYTGNSNTPWVYSDGTPVS